MERKSININNRTISYRAGGEGDAVILLHGFGEDSNVWQQQAEYLEKNFFVITPDIPGSGDSELTDDVSMEGIADCVNAIADAEELDKLVLIGHSMGGYATLAYAEKYEDRLQGFGIFHATASADSEEKKVARRKSIDFIKRNGADAFLDAQPANLFARQTQENDPALIRSFRKSYADFTETALIEYYEAMIARPDRTEVLKNSKVPVLFILGEYDNLIPLEPTLQQASLPGVATIEILKNSGHMGMLEEPAKSNQVLDDFLSDIAVYNRTM